MPEVLSSPEIMGEIGLSSPVLRPDETDKVAKQVSDFGEAIASSARDAEEYEELLESLVELSEEFIGGEQPTRSGSNQDQIHFGEVLYQDCIDQIAALDDIVGTENAEIILEFINDLEQQRHLSTVSSVAFLFLADDQGFLRKYANQFIRRAPPLTERLVELEESEERDVEELLNIARSIGPLLETAIPPVVTIVHFLESDDLDMGRSAELSLRDAIDLIRRFDHLSPIAGLVNVDYRNGVGHGGKTGGPVYNPINDQIQLTYRRGDQIETEVLHREEFEQAIFEMFSAVFALFLLPIVIITAHITATIEGAKS